MLGVDRRNARPFSEFPSADTQLTGGKAMRRYVFPALAAVILIGASLFPDDAFARRGGGGGFRGGGGFHGGAAHFRGGAVHAGRGYGVAGRGYAGRPVARAAVRGGVWRGAAYGAAAGAAAAGAYGYYNNGYNSGCYRDSYGNPVCPQQYPY